MSSGPTVGRWGCDRGIRWDTGDPHTRPYARQHVSVQAERRILFCGDALFNANPITGRPGLRLPIRLATLDNAQARDSVRKLSTMAVEVLCCGHGEPILDGAGEKMRALLREENA